MSPRTERGNPGPLILLQSNVRRSRTVQELALAQAFEARIDVVLLQEPYIFCTERRVTTRHPFYECFTPTDDWNSKCPRVLTYVRKGIGLSCTQRRPTAEGPDSAATADLLFLEIASSTYQPVLVVNVYNAPPGSNGVGMAARALTSLSATMFERCVLLAGDFNLHHERWQPSLQNGPTNNADAFVAWMDSIPLTFISELDKPTHDRGNVLDLVLASSELLNRGVESMLAT